MLASAIWLVYIGAMSTGKEEIVRQVPMPIGAIVIYPVTQEELEKLEDGGPSSTILAFGLALFGAGIGGLISLLLATPWPKEPTVSFVISLIVVGLTLFGGAILLGIWVFMPNPVKATLKKIKDRAEAPPAAMGEGNATEAAGLLPPATTNLMQVNVVSAAQPVKEEK